MFENIFNNDDMIRLQNKLRDNNQTITCAESCTGGLVASMITEVSGSSSIFRGSLISYCNEIKEQELNVKKETMIEFGVVSSQVVEQMCLGALKKFNANFAIGISGVAGPGGGTDKKPVGTVVIGVVSSFGDKSIEIFHFKGDRKEVQIQAAKTALKKNFEILFKKA